MASTEVKSEYEQGIELDKLIVPVLLDASPMPADLSQFQAIDLRLGLGEHPSEELKVRVDVEGNYYDDGWRGRVAEQAERRVITEAERAWEEELRRSIADHLEEVKSSRIKLAGTLLSEVFWHRVLGAPNTTPTADG